MIKLPSKTIYYHSVYTSVLIIIINHVLMNNKPHVNDQVQEEEEEEEDHGHRVLSVQSHVVSGYVGNKCATFPLQLLGLEVDWINSVQLSNHTGFPHHPGQVLTGVHLRELVDGLRDNGIFQYTHLLTGYVGNVDFLKQLVQVVNEAKQLSPRLTYVCDPVMGDNGKMYVPMEFVGIYRDELLPLADIVTPNQFEAELLSGIRICKEKDAIRALDVLHEKGASTVVITGSHLALEDGANDRIVGFASDGTDKWRFDIPKIEGSFTGTGDLFASVLTAWAAKTTNNGSIKEPCEKAVSTLQHVLKRTLEEYSTYGKRFRDTELMDVQLVKCKKQIEDPEIIVQLRKINN